MSNGLETTYLMLVTRECILHEMQTSKHGDSILEQQVVD